PAIAPMIAPPAAPPVPPIRVLFSVCVIPSQPMSPTTRTSFTVTALIFRITRSFYTAWGSVLARPFLGQEAKFRLHRLLVQILRMRLRPGNEQAKGLVARRGWRRETDQGLGTLAVGFGYVVVVSPYEVAMTEVNGLAVARIIGGRGAQVEQILRRLRLEIRCC